MDSGAEGVLKVAALHVGKGLKFTLVARAGGECMLV